MKASLYADQLNPIAELDPTGEVLTTTLGDARRQALDFAAALWAQSLRSEVTIRVAVASRRISRVRATAITAGANLVWSGPSGMAEASKLSSGTSPEGYIEMYAPSPVDVLSSLSHFASTVAPNEIQEPFYVEDTEMDFCLTLALFADLGWGEKVPCEAGVLVPAE